MALTSHRRRWKIYVKICCGNAKRRNHLTFVGKDKQIILKLILISRMSGCELDSSCSGKIPVAGSCRDENATKGSIKKKENALII
jgi:hypothetical protein